MPGGRPTLPGGRPIRPGARSMWRRDDRCILGNGQLMWRRDDQCILGGVRSMPLGSPPRRRITDAPRYGVRTRYARPTFRNRALPRGVVTVARAHILPRVMAGAMRLRVMAGRATGEDTIDKLALRDKAGVQGL